MIIVSQDKRTILNFSNIQDVRIEDYGTHQKGVKIYKIYAGNFEGYATLLGTYKTEERAKEVLQEIIDRYKECTAIYKNKTGNNIINILEFPKVYEMPED